MPYIVQLTTAQQADIAKLKTALVSAQAVVRAAQQTLNTHLGTLIPASAGKRSKFSVHSRIQVSDDSASLIIG